MFEFIIAVVLHGSVIESSESGRIGIRVGNNRINHVYIHSSAIQYLKVGDQVISSDERPGTFHILGPVGSYCHIIILREGKELEYYIPRVSWKVVKDDK